MEAQSPSAVTELITECIFNDDQEFAETCYQMAVKLNDAQFNRSTKGGILVSIRGTVGEPKHHFVALIKAEPHNGYEVQRTHANHITLKYIHELLLTPSSKLYKAACYRSKIPVAEIASKESFLGSNANDRWEILVTDYQLSGKDGKAAAYYFYSNFLELSQPKTAATNTRDFFDHAYSFISQMDAPPEQKILIKDALSTYLKANQSQTVSVEEFASDYFEDADTIDNFTNHMYDSGVPNHGFAKDISFLSSKLQTTQFKFMNNVQLSVPGGAAKDLIKIESIDSDPTNPESNKEWTRVTIKSKLLPK